MATADHHRHGSVSESIFPIRFVAVSCVRQKRNGRHGWWWWCQTPMAEPDSTLALSADFSSPLSLLPAPAVVAQHAQQRTAVSPASSWQAEEEDEEDYEMGVSGMTGMWGGKEESETDYEVHYQEPASHSQSPQVATAKSTKAVDEVKQKAALTGQCADFPTLGPHDMTLPKAKAASFEARRGVHDPGWAEDFGSAQAQRSQPRGHRGCQDLARASRGFPACNIRRQPWACLLERSPQASLVPRLLRLWKRWSPRARRRQLRRRWSPRARRRNAFLRAPAPAGYRSH
jgi:hypothetical protein